MVSKGAGGVCSEFEFALLSHQAEGFWLYLVLTGTVMVQGGVIFLHVNDGGVWFFVHNIFWGEVWVGFSSMLGPASLSVNCILTPLILQEQLPQGG